MASTGEPGASDIVARLEAALPVDDLLAFVLRDLLSEQPAAGREELMERMRAVYAAGFEIAPADAPSPSVYRLGEHELRAFPQRVLARRNTG